MHPWHRALRAVGRGRAAQHDAHHLRGRRQADGAALPARLGARSRRAQRPLRVRARRVPCSRKGPPTWQGPRRARRARGRLLARRHPLPRHAARRVRPGGARDRGRPRGRRRDGGGCPMDEAARHGARRAAGGGARRAHHGGGGLHRRVWRPRAALPLAGRLPGRRHAQGAADGAARQVHRGWLDGRAVRGGGPLAEVHRGDGAAAAGQARQHGLLLTRRRGANHRVSQRGHGARAWAAVWPCLWAVPARQSRRPTFAGRGARAAGRSIATCRARRRGLSPAAALAMLACGRRRWATPRI
mmetsp:Transcript_24943/g.81460  ORF Transcript_24943/g.81460 Transcript_24943/m.81460 type:complete len:300 (+) Transcript_24943:1528-2427(+)